MERDRTIAADSLRFCTAVTYSWRGTAPLPQTQVLHRRHLLVERDRTIAADSVEAASVMHRRHLLVERDRTISADSLRFCTAVTYS